MIDLNLEIKGFGKINEANVKLNKINVVGGVNASGKSTVSRLLYSFLKADVLSDKKYLKKRIVDEINELIDSEEISLTIDDDLLAIQKIYGDIVVGTNIESEIKNLIEFLSKDRNHVSSEMLSMLIYAENVCFFTGISRLYNSTYESVMGNEGVNAEFDDANFVESYDENEFDASTDLYVIKTRGKLDNFNDVLYIDSFSCLDLFEMLSHEILAKEQNNFLWLFKIHLKNHVWYLLDSLKDSNDDKPKNNYIIPLVDKISKIIYGNMYSSSLDDFRFTDYHDSIDVSSDIESTSSGVKQVSIIQLLLLNGKLKPNTVLIFDEPEVNLHPMWQFKFAEILVLLVKELDITIYINSHSPMFIESIDAFTEYYDMMDDVNYYLTEESEIKGKYDFNKINSDELYKIYDNLGDPYDLIDQLRLRKRLGE